VADLSELRSRIAALAGSSPAPRRVEGATVFSSPRTTAPLGNVSQPVMALVAQGAKRSVLGNRAFDYAAGQFLVVTVDLPLTSQIAMASTSSPFLAASLPLDAGTIAELILDSRQAPSPVREGPGTGSPDGPALSVSDAGPELIDAVVRLLRLADSPGDRQILGPAVRREIHWRLLTGPQGGLVRQVGLAGSRVSVVSLAIAWIKDHYDEVIRMEDLAAGVHLSVSALNRHFRAATSMSPLQYQKQIRLQRARVKLLADPSDIAGVGHSVGYASVSQFTREYRRMFGAPPGADAARLQRSSVVVE
jgi:AraC-like DNA-binding protein